MKWAGMDDHAKEVDYSERGIVKYLRLRRPPVFSHIY